MMLEIVQLQDGNYKVVIDYSGNGYAIHREYIFALTDSDAEPLENGESIRIEFKNSSK